MESKSLVAFFRTGCIPPVRILQTKAKVMEMLGEPSDWGGRIHGYSWQGSLIEDFRQSMNWRYGSVCVSFDDFDRVSSMSVSYHYYPEGPIEIPPVFGDFPGVPLALGDLEDLMSRHGLDCDPPPDMGIAALRSGGVAVCCPYGKSGRDAPVIGLCVVDEKLLA